LFAFAKLAAAKKSLRIFALLFLFFWVTHKSALRTATKKKNSRKRRRAVPEFRSNAQTSFLRADWQKKNANKSLRIFFCASAHFIYLFFWAFMPVCALMFY